MGSEHTRAPGDFSVFLGEARRKRQTTGSVAPSSPWLARTMTRALGLRSASSPLRVAEVGPGTGAITREIASWMRNDDSLDVFDVNERLLSHLERVARTDLILQTRKISFHLLDARFVETRGPFDVLLSGLPFAHFHPDLVKAILDGYLRAVVPGGTISYFGYAGALGARKLISSRARRREITELASLLRTYLAAHQVREDLVLLNIPPAVVHHLRVPGVPRTP